MNALEQKLASLLPQEMLALLEKIETIEGAEDEWVIAQYINSMPLTKFQHTMLVRAYRRYEARRARFKAMELLFPPNKGYQAETYTYGTSGVSLSNTPLVLHNGNIAPQRTFIQRSKVGHI